MCDGLWIPKYDVKTLFICSISVVSVCAYVWCSCWIYVEPKWLWLIYKLQCCISFESDHIQLWIFRRCEWGARECVCVSVANGHLKDSSLQLRITSPINICGYFSPALGCMCVCVCLPAFILQIDLSGSFFQVEKNHFFFVFKWRDSCVKVRLIDVWEEMTCTQNEDQNICECVWMCRCFWIGRCFVERTNCFERNKARKDATETLLFCFSTIRWESFTCWLTPCIFLRFSFTKHSC